jgi:hypothetical protein
MEKYFYQLKERILFHCSMKTFSVLQVHISDMAAAALALMKDLGYITRNR